MQTVPDNKCRLTGLNLQAANTVINVDLPWNPAVLDQRIARAHRMRQSRPVQVYLLVTDGTIEESLLQTLMLQRDLTLAALDADSDVNEIQMTSNSDDLNRRLEILLGAAFHFLGELVAQQHHEQQPAPELALNLKNRLAECITADDSGRQRLTITLPSVASLDSMANALARLLSIGDAGGK